MKDASAYRQSPVALCWTDTQSRIVAVNEQFERLMARSANDLRGRPIIEIIPLAVDAINNAVTARGDPLEFRLPDRRETFQLAAAAVQEADRTPSGLSLAIIDVSSQKKIEEKLSTFDERIAFALESAGQWIWELDIASGRVWRSRGWKAILGFAEDELPDENVAWSIVHPDDREMAKAATQRVLNGEESLFESTYRVGHKDGSWRWILSRGKIVHGHDGSNSTRLLATSVDITGQKEIEQALEAAIAEKKQLEQDLRDANRNLQRLTETDFLTSLSNRRKFDMVLEDEVRHAAKSGSTVGLLMIDVDFFKPYNDLYGHVAGDACLRMIAAALNQCVHANSALVSRYGGEEFAVVLTNTTQADVTGLAGRMSDTIRRREVPHGGSPFGVVTVSIGIAALNSSDGTRQAAQQFVRQADQALYRAKASGRGTVMS
ncbi:sensor domain-containing diguanylate cyclase [Mesorhizobium sp. ASY16-5R]|uniref:sensor domain-containing diguanylate cyclase n=1 Tax=Mesorhizobium sp. ASY16-5R TaxID=3445772 RepID=UPI003FA15B74